MNPELLVGFAGAIGAGKNAAASSIPRAVVIEHADPIYWMLSAMLQAPVEDLRDRRAKETPIVGLGKSVRDLLRSLGTEWGRERVHPDLWVKLAGARIDQHLATGQTRFAIPGVRFQNEIDAIRRRGGFVVWVYSPNVAKADGPFKPHRSDRMIGQLDCDVVLVNDGPVETLAGKVELAVELGARAFESGQGLGHEWTTPKPNGRQPIRRGTRGRPWRRCSFSTP